MNPKRQSATAQPQGLVAELLRDKKKTAILAVLVVVGAVMGLRLIGKDGPAVAQAQAVAVPAADADGAAVIPKAQDILKTIEQRKTNRDRVRVFKRDLFGMNEDLFTLLESPVAQPAPAKRPVGPAFDPDLELKRRTQRVEQEAKLLCLQITIVSDNPTAIINGDPFGIGDSVCAVVKDSDASETKAEFKIVRIGAKVCTVVRDGVSVELRMKDDKP
ncbi:MAG: hypothetical protein ABFD92_14685 [Planctomycetaceae bacterium]|nr:hypothetical protein [Planctomycetaceae bacterium]